MKKTIRAIVVSHTHWDRAWYLPFEAYRVRLTHTVEQILTILESDADYHSFTLDGQTGILEDILEVTDPKMRERLEHLISQGRLVVGPWYSLPDLFLPCGEAIIRNLQLGLRMSRQFGGGLQVGYIPDPFGHFAQLPQILNGFSLDSFIFMRGMPEEHRERLGNLFNWESPHGDRVLAIYQPDGYIGGSALGHPSIFGRFDGHTPSLQLARERMGAALDRILSHQQESTALIGNGGDHMPAQPEVPRLLTELQREFDDVRFQHGTFRDFVTAVRAENCEHATFVGDLIGNADHPILLNVYSTRTYLKQRNHRAQQQLVRHVEPFFGCLQIMGLVDTPAHLIDHAWKLLLRNQAHDDICGCSVDAVHREDEVRFDQVDQIAESLLTQGLEKLIAHGFAKLQPSTGGGDGVDVWVFNPHPFPLRAKVQTTVLLPDSDEFGPPRIEREIQVRDAAGNNLPYKKIASAAKQIRNRFLETTWGRSYDVAFAMEIPPLGYHLVRIEETDSPEMSADFSIPVCLEQKNNTLSLKNASGTQFSNIVPRIEYEIDDGDTYSWSPVSDIPLHTARITELNRSHAGTDLWTATAELQIPSHYDRKSGVGPSVTMPITLTFAADFHGGVNVTISYTNIAKNGRLRVLFPCGVSTDEFAVDGHFRLVPAKAIPSDPHIRAPIAYPGELQYSTHHQGDYAWVQHDDFCTWVANRGLPEVELVQRDNQSFIAVTLHRAVGKLSVGAGAIRGCQAGPSVDTPEAQCLRPFVHQLAFGRSHGTAENARVAALTFSHPPWVQEMPYLPYCKGQGCLPRTASWLSQNNPWIDLSAVKPAQEDSAALAIRLCNLSNKKQEATLTTGFTPSAICYSSLAENWDSANAITTNKQQILVTINPHEIKTILVKA